MHGASKVQREATCRRIAQAREAAGLTQEALAQHLNALFGVAVSVRDIHRYEKSRVPWYLLDEIGRLTGTSKAWLLYGDREIGGVPSRLPERAGATFDEVGTAKAAAWRLSRGRALAGLALGLLLGVTVQSATQSTPAAVVVLVATVLVAWLRTSPRRP